MPISHDTNQEIERYFTIWRGHFKTHRILLLFDQIDVYFKFKEDRMCDEILGKRAGALDLSAEVVLKPKLNKV